jgi:hypothetical protein
MLIVLELDILQLWFGLCMDLLSLDVMMLSVNALDQDWVEQTLIKLKRELKVNQHLGLCLFVGLCKVRLSQSPW